MLKRSVIEKATAARRIPNAIHFFVVILSRFYTCFPRYKGAMKNLDGDVAFQLGVIGHSSRHVLKHHGDVAASITILCTAGVNAMP